MKRLFVLAALVGCQGTCSRAKSTPIPTPSASASASASATATMAEGPPGVVIDHSPASSGAYVGSPSIAVLPDGSYVASHDFFGPGTHNDHSVIFGSTDRGEHWTKLADIDGLWWATLFVHERLLYVMGTSKRFGHVVIRRSSDGGRIWTSPSAADSGLLTTRGGYHCAPVPVVVADGRIWRAFEHAGTSGDRVPFEALALSAPVTADLLHADSWTETRAVTGDQAWLGGQFDNWLEGNIVATSDGKVVDLLRVNSKANREWAAMVHVSTAAATFTTTDFVDFPGGSKKFTVRFDTTSKLYWSLANTITQPHEGAGTDKIRNTLTLTSSPDLRTWTARAVIVRHPDRAKHAFQYVDWSFDGDDLIAVSRTSYDDDTGGAHTYHDANYMTFHRVSHFRDAETPLDAGAAFESADFAISGEGFSLEKLDVGTLAFANRKYVWTDVPAKFRGWNFTRVAGGLAPHLRVHAKRNATLTIAMGVGAATPSGWHDTGSHLVYDDPKRSEMRIVERTITTGQDVVVPEGTWSGALVLVSP